MFRTRVKLALAAAAIAALSPLARAGTLIYQDNFDGTGGVVAGRTPTTTNGSFGGTAGATWTSDAAATTNPDAVFTATGGTYTNTGSTNAAIGTFTTGADANLITNAYLPFTPQAGQVYDFHLAVAASGVGASGNWLGMAFTQAGLNGHAAGGASSALSNDNPYGLIILKGSGVVQIFGGVGTANQQTTAATVTASTTTPVYTPVDVLLDTTNAAWTVSWLLNGTQIGSFAYATNPTIGDVVFGSNKLTGAVGDFSLTTTATPEPASLALLAVGTLVSLRRHRRDHA